MRLMAGIIAAGPGLGSRPQKRTAEFGRRRVRYERPARVEPNRLLSILRQLREPHGNVHRRRLCSRDNGISVRFAINETAKAPSIIRVQFVREIVFRQKSIDDQRLCKSARGLAAIERPFSDKVDLDDAFVAEKLIDAVQDGPEFRVRVGVLRIHRRLSFWEQIEE